MRAGAAGALLAAAAAAAASDCSVTTPHGRVDLSHLPSQTTYMMSGGSGCRPSASGGLACFDPRLGPQARSALLMRWCAWAAQGPAVPPPAQPRSDCGGHAAMVGQDGGCQGAFNYSTYSQENGIQWCKKGERTCDSSSRVLRVAPEELQVEWVLRNPEGSRNLLVRLRCDRRMPRGAHPRPTELIYDYQRAAGGSVTLTTQQGRLVAVVHRAPSERVTVMTFYSGDACPVDPQASERCPWLLGHSGADDIAECRDGSRCNIQDDPSCCEGKAGGRARCPRNLPVMCEQRECAGGNDHCCGFYSHGCRPRPCQPVSALPAPAAPHSGGWRSPSGAHDGFLYLGKGSCADAGLLEPVHSERSYSREDCRGWCAGDDKCTGYAWQSDPRLPWCKLYTTAEVPGASKPAGAAAAGEIETTTKGNCRIACYKKQPQGPSAARGQPHYGWGYELAPDGRCPKGTEPVTSDAECTFAATSVGLEEVSLTVADARRPRGCYLKPHNAQGYRLWFNTAGVTNSSDTARRVLCATPAAHNPSPAAPAPAPAGRREWAVASQEGPQRSACPRLAAGDGSSLGACMGSCDAAPGCNTVNYDTARQGCELLSCSGCGAGSPGGCELTREAADQPQWKGIGPRQVAVLAAGSSSPAPAGVPLYIVGGARGAALSSESAPSPEAKDAPPGLQQQLQYKDQAWAWCFMASAAPGAGLIDVGSLAGTARKWYASTRPGPGMVRFDLWHSGPEKRVWLQQSPHQGLRRTGAERVGQSSLAADFWAEPCGAAPGLAEPRRQWTRVSPADGDGYAAACRPLATGAGWSLGACQAACERTASCDTINYLGAEGTAADHACFLKQCTQCSVRDGCKLQSTAAPFRVYTRLPQPDGYRLVARAVGCAEGARIALGCGECGPMWGGPSACQRLCDATPGCRFAVSYNDSSCRAYSECSGEATAPGRPGAEAAVWAQLSRPSPSPADLPRRTHDRRYERVGYGWCRNEEDPYRGRVNGIRRDFGAALAEQSEATCRAMCDSQDSCVGYAHASDGPIAGRCYVYLGDVLDVATLPAGWGVFQNNHYRIGGSSGGSGILCHRVIGAVGKDPTPNATTLYSVRHVGRGQCVDARGGSYHWVSVLVARRDTCKQLLLRTPRARGVGYEAYNGACNVFFDAGSAPARLEGLDGPQWASRDGSCWVAGSALMAQCRCSKHHWGSHCGSYEGSGPVAGAEQQHAWGGYSLYDDEQPDCYAVETVAPRRCGDGVLAVAGNAGEACDDGNLRDGDGCSSRCSVEPGWRCEGAEDGARSICSRLTEAPATSRPSGSPSAFPTGATGVPSGSPSWGPWTLFPSRAPATTAPSAGPETPSPSRFPVRVPSAAPSPEPKDAFGCTGGESWCVPLLRCIPRSDPQRCVAAAVAILSSCGAPGSCGERCWPEGGPAAASPTAAYYCQVSGECAASEPPADCGPQDDDLPGEWAVGSLLNGQGRGGEGPAMRAADGGGDDTDPADHILAGRMLSMSAPEGGEHHDSERALGAAASLIAGVLVLVAAAAVVLALRWRRASAEAQAKAAAATAALDKGPPPGTTPDATADAAAYAQLPIQA
eukprot:TRINITY_DN9506_c0_g1_i1.p1 TRINITY_DN9506_c0_g1~~TRINITY_DN9506_c0_g1_i1.p1  ORF type:complete len:1606 (+),score=461.71 TRINITY_DN9506_c0_g1_i1:84-4820(+)